MLGQTTFIVQTTIEGKNYKWDDGSNTNKTFEIVANIDKKIIINFNQIQIEIKDEVAKIKNFKTVKEVEQLVNSYILNKYLYIKISYNIVGNDIESKNISIELSLSIDGKNYKWNYNTIEAKKLLLNVDSTLVFKNSNMAAMQGVDSMAYAKSKNKTYFIDSKDTVGSGVSLYLYSIIDQSRITKENANTQIGAGKQPKNLVNFNDKLYYSYIGTSSNDSVLVSFSIENDKKEKEINLKTLNIFERGNPVKGLISTENNLYIIGTGWQVASMDKNQKVTLLNNNENKNIKSKFVFFDNKIFLADSLSNKVEYFDTTSKHMFN